MTTVGLKVDVKRKNTKLSPVLNKDMQKLEANKELDPELAEVKAEENKENIKNTDTRFSFTKNLAKLTKGNREGWNAPPGKPFVPIRLTETHTAIEMVKKELPNTRKRLQRNTYRNFLVIQKRKRDIEDELSKMNKGRQMDDQIQI